MPSRDVVILSAARTPIGKYSGAFRDVHPAELGSVAARAAIDEERFARVIVQVTLTVKGQPTVIDCDEHPRGDTTIGSLRKVSPVFGEIEGQPGGMGMAVAMEII